MSWFDWFRRRDGNLQKPQNSNPLAGKPLRYLIGADNAGDGHPDEITEVPYGAPPVKHGISIGYCNLLDENYSLRQCGPYLKQSDTAEQYAEGVIDPKGHGWLYNLSTQFKVRLKQRFEYIELDNPDAYDVADVIGAIEIAAQYGLKVIAKNPGLMERGSHGYVAHPNVFGIIVEKGAGDPGRMDALRRQAGKPDLPVWFVAFGDGRQWAGDVASIAQRCRNMGVTFSSRSEYGSSEDIVRPRP